MGDWVRIVGWSVVSALKSQRDLTLENLALRHQLMVLQRQSGRSRLVEPPEMGDVVALAQGGGLHHRYTRRLAA